MKFVYKINSGYDGFTPSQLPARMGTRRLLSLGWTKYLDDVERLDEVWIYFRGPHRFAPGVYVKGFIFSIDGPSQQVFLRVRESSTIEPLSDGPTSARIGEIVATRYRQVFLLPEEFEPAPRCTVDSIADTCVKRRCSNCTVWKALPLVSEESLNPPYRLGTRVRDYVPGFWVIPPRCYLFYKTLTIAAPIRKTSEMFKRFKVGEKALAYPLALAIYTALGKRDLLEFDAVVPIPLSPDKQTAGEMHRTRLLATELAKLLDSRVGEYLSLSGPISKRRLIASGFRVQDFEQEYGDLLEVDSAIQKVERILLVDDVCTNGSTLRSAARKIRQVNADCEIVAATAGQMIMKAVVADESVLLA